MASAEIMAGNLGNGNACVVKDPWQSGSGVGLFGERKGAGWSRQLSTHSVDSCCFDDNDIGPRSPPPSSQSGSDRGRPGDCNFGIKSPTRPRGHDFNVAMSYGKVVLAEDETSNASTINDADSGIGTDSSLPSPGSPAVPRACDKRPQHQRVTTNPYGACSKTLNKRNVPGKTPIGGKGAEHPCLCCRLLARHPEPHGWTMPVITLQTISSLRIARIPSKNYSRDYHCGFDICSSHNGVSRKVAASNSNGLTYECKWDGCRNGPALPKPNHFNRSFQRSQTQGSNSNNYSTKRCADAFQILVDHIHNQHLQRLEHSAPTAGALEDFDIPALPDRDADSSADYTCLWSGCKYYGQAIRSLAWVKRHVLFHVSPTPFRCMIGVCRASFSSHLSLERHINCRHLRRPSKAGAELWLSQRAANISATASGAENFGSLSNLASYQTTRQRSDGDGGSRETNPSAISRQDYISCHLYDVMALKLYDRAGFMGPVNHCPASTLATPESLERAGYPSQNTPRVLPPNGLSSS